MKKLLTLIMMMLCGICGAQADVVVTRGEQVTDPSKLLDGDCILLQNSGYYFAGGNGVSNTATFGYDNCYVVKAAGTAGYYLASKASIDAGTPAYIPSGSSTIGALVTEETSAAIFTMSAEFTSDGTNYKTGDGPIRFIYGTNFLNSQGGGVAKYASGTGGWSWWYVFRAVIEDGVDYTVSYTQYSTKDDVEIGTGSATITGTATGYKFTAPAINGYTFDHATDGEGTTLDLSAAITATTLKLYYAPFNLTGMVVKGMGAAITSLEALTDGYYAVFDANSERYGYLTINSSNIGYNHNMTDGTTITSTDYAIYVAKDGDNYTFRLPNDKYVPVVSRGSSLSASAASVDPVGFVVTLADAATAAFNVKNTANDQYWNANGPSSFNPLCGWDNAHPIKFYPLTIVDEASVTYSDITINVMSGGSVVETAVIDDAISGNEYKIADYFNVNGVTFTPETVTATTADQTINVTYTYASPYPFEENASFSAIKKWYYLQIRPDSKQSYVVYNSEGDPNVTCPTAKPSNLDNARWAFIGSTDPFIGEGLTIVNKAAGEGLILAADSPQGDGGTGKNTYGTMEAAGNKTYEVWYAETSSWGTNGFFLKNADKDYFNLRSNENLAFWTTGHDVGSTFTVVEAPDVDKTLLAQALGAASMGVLGDGLGEYSGATEEEVNNAIGVGSLVYMNPNATQEEVDAQVLALMEIASKITINVPATNTFLRIKGHSTNLYLKGSENVGNNVPNSEGTETDGTDIWYYGADNCLVNYATSLGLIGTSKVAGITQTKETTTFQQSHSTATDASIAGVYEILSNYSGSKFWYSNTDKLDRNSVNNNARCEWDLEYVTELPVAVTDAGYATLYAPVALTIPAGVEAFAVSAIANDEATLTAVETTIPANTAVILKAAEGAYTFAIASSDATVENKLAGTVPAIEWTDEFTLQNSDAGVGLFSKEVAQLAGFKAYLPASEVPAGVKGVKFDIETAVKAIEAAQEAGEIMYDLNGRRIFKAQKGVYIINGKKIAIK